jgi:hypothetical protein
MILQVRICDLGRNTIEVIQCSQCIQLRTWRLQEADNAPSKMSTFYYLEPVNILPFLEMTLQM